MYNNHGVFRFKYTSSPGAPTPSRSSRDTLLSEVGGVYYSTGVLVFRETDLTPFFKLVLSSDIIGTDSEVPVHV